MKLFVLCILVLFLVPLSSAVIEFGGPSGTDNTASIESDSNLWNWESVPLSHDVDGSQLNSGLRIDPPDISIMETPLPTIDIFSRGLKDPIVFGGFSDMSSSDQNPFYSEYGIFDCSSFKTPSQDEFPRVY